MVKRKVNMPTRIWTSLQEPKIVTVLIIWAYFTSILAGVFLIQYSIFDNKQLYDPLAIITGITLIVFGALGVPSAWTGKHWFERAAALGMALGGALVSLTFGTAFWVHRTLPIFGPDAFFAIVWSSMSVILGLTRFERCRLSPYTAGKGPLLPEHRKTMAIQRMNDDWEKATKKLEE